MSRLIRLVAFFICGVCLVGIPMFAFAETTPAIPVPGEKIYTCASGTGSSWAAACTAAGGYAIDCNNESSNKLCFSTSAGNGVGSCPYGVNKCSSEANASFITGAPTYKCPSGQNWTLTDQTCTRPDCVSPQVRGSDGKCSRACTSPESLQADGSCRSTCFKAVVTPTGSCLSPTPCTNSSLNLNDILAASSFGGVCSDKKTDSSECPAGGQIVGTFEGKPMCITPYKEDAECTAAGGTITGTLNGKPVCTKATETAKCGDGSTAFGTANGTPVCADGCPAGSAKGTVGAVSSCYPIGPVTNKDTTIKSTDVPDSTKVNGVEVGTSSKSTTCTGDRCTTTKSDTDSAGTTTKTETTSSKTDYCTENPKASTCKNATEEDKYCTDNPEAVSCMKSGTPTEEGALESRSIGVTSFSMVSVASNMSCPADIALPKGKVFSWKPICDGVGMFRPIVLAVAWLGAALIVIGAAKNG